MSAGKDDHLLLTLHGDLADLLLRQYRPSTEILYPLSRRASIKDILEAVGIPHTEIGAIEKHAQQLDFSYQPIPETTSTFSPLLRGRQQPRRTCCAPTRRRGSASWST